MPCPIRLDATCTTLHGKIQEKGYPGNSGEVRRIDIKDMDKAKCCFEELFLVMFQGVGCMAIIHEAKRLLSTFDIHSMSIG
jgi:hypothetical protein